MVSHNILDVTDGENDKYMSIKFNTQSVWKNFSINIFPDNLLLILFTIIFYNIDRLVYQSKYK